MKARSKISSTSPSPDVENIEVAKNSTEYGDGALFDGLHCITRSFYQVIILLRKALG